MLFLGFIELAFVTIIYQNQSHIRTFPFMCQSQSQSQKLWYFHLLVLQPLRLIDLEADLDEAIGIMDLEIDIERTVKQLRT